MTKKKGQILEEDKQSIDSLTQMFFSIFTNKNNQKPRWKIIEETCIPEALIIKKEKLSQEIYNLERFIAPRKQILTDGTLQDFEERETDEETVIIGNIAQRKTRFYKEGLYNNVPFSQFGNKFFQFMKTSTGWRITSVIWEDE